MNLLEDIRDTADALTEPHIHSEPVRTWDHNRNRKIRQHRIVLPGLLAQLYQAVIPACSSGAAPAGGVPGSRPPLAIEALSRHDEIAMAVLGWCHALHLPSRVSVESNVRAIVGAAPGLDDADARELLGQLRRWKRWCAVFTGWENLFLPAGVPCPVSTCEEINTLRINLTAKTGMCGACGTAWAEGDGGIFVLAGYVNAMTSPEKVA